MRTRGRNQRARKERGEVQAKTRKLAKRQTSHVESKKEQKGIMKEVELEKNRAGDAKRERGGTGKIEGTGGNKKRGGNHSSSHSSPTSRILLNN